jgi:hypothetical protein
MLNDPSRRVRFPSRGGPLVAFEDYVIRLLGDFPVVENCQAGPSAEGLGATSGGNWAGKAFGKRFKASWKNLRAKFPGKASAQSFREALQSFQAKFRENIAGQVSAQIFRAKHSGSSSKLPGDVREPPQSIQ